ncbi:MAG: hypothetical protein M1825_002672 [Sarcosagium campestre]|nr:MAG: hypothetical protein M1825_002672 [Sarcosagium campestre]
MTTDRAAPASSTYPHALPSPLLNCSAPPYLHAQGAEALLYRTTFLQPERACALKHRPRKPYRHPLLDARLTRHRILSEARVLAKLRAGGLDGVPALYALDADEGWLMMEWVEGRSVRDVLLERQKRAAREPSGGGEVTPHEDARHADVGNEADSTVVIMLMHKVGAAVARMHSLGIVHGDLTTSNIMIRGDGPHGDVVLIDFGLANQTVMDEDRAVDLYVLERAFGSSHGVAGEGWWKQVVVGYETYGWKGARSVLKRLEDVRTRGRKRSMIG